MKIKDRELYSSNIAGHDNKPVELDKRQREQLEQYGDAIRENFHKPLWGIDFYPERGTGGKESGNEYIYEMLRKGALRGANRIPLPPLETVGDLMKISGTDLMRQTPDQKKLNKIAAGLRRMGVDFSMDPAVLAHAMSEGKDAVAQPPSEDLPIRYQTLNDPTVLYDQILPPGSVFGLGSKKAALQFYERARAAFAEGNGPHRTEQGEVEASYRYAIKLLPDNNIYLSDVALPIVANADITAAVVQRVPVR